MCRGRQSAGLRGRARRSRPSAGLPRPRDGRSRPGPGRGVRRGRGVGRRGRVVGLRGRGPGCRGRGPGRRVRRGRGVGLRGRGGWASAAGGRAGVFAAANADWRYRCCAALTFAEVNRIRARQQQAAVTFITANALGRWRLRARSATTRRSPARTARPGVRQRERRRSGVRQDERGTFARAAAGEGAATRPTPRRGPPDSTISSLPQSASHPAAHLRGDVGPAIDDRRPSGSRDSCLDAGAARPRDTGTGVSGPVGRQDPACTQVVLPIVEFGRWPCARARRQQGSSGRSGHPLP